MKKRETTAKRENKVYIPNQGAGHDFSKAERFGELVYVTYGMLNPFEIGFLNRKWEVALRNSKPTDYILITSLPIACMIGSAVFARKHKRLNVLIYAKADVYLERLIYF